MTTTQQATIHDLENIPDSACRHELIRGEIVEMPPSGGEHGEIGMAIGSSLMAHVKSNQLGKVYGADTGFIVERDPDTVLAPDAAFVRAGRLPSREARRGIMPVVPDLAVEVISPSDRVTQITDKVMLYLKHGVELVWLVHPGQRIVTVYTPDLVARTLTESGTLDGGDVLPGFQLLVSEIFEE